MKKILSTCLHAIIFGLFLAGTVSVIVFAQGNDTPTFQQIMNSLFSEQQNGSWTLKANSVTSDTIADGTVTAADLEPGLMQNNLGEIISVDGNNIQINGEISGALYKYNHLTNAEPGKLTPPIEQNYSYPKCIQVTATGNKNSKYGYSTAELGDICADIDGCSVKVVVAHIQNPGGDSLKVTNGTLAIDTESRDGTRRYATLRLRDSVTGFWLGDNHTHRASILDNWTHIQDTPRAGANLQDDVGSPLATNTSMAILSHPHTSATWTFCD
jgi:hypothetical protein